MTAAGFDHAEQLPGRDGSDRPSRRFLPAPAVEENVRGDHEGRALYERRAALLTGLTQPQAPTWQELEESVRGRWRDYAARSLATGCRTMRRGTEMGATLELTETVTRHDWQQVDDGPEGDGTRLSLSVSLGSRLGDTVRGTLDRPADFHHRLEIRDGELTGPQEVPEAWAGRARTALAQLRLRAAGEPHVIPDSGGRWDVTVRHRLRSTGAEHVRSGTSPHCTFVPTQVFVDASTSGAGLVCLFGDGPVETHSARYGFAVGVGGTVAFDQVDQDTQVPDWAQEPAREAAREAFELRAAADRHLRHGITTGQG